MTSRTAEQWRQAWLRLKAGLEQIEEITLPTDPAECRRCLTLAVLIAASTLEADYRERAAE